MFNSRYFKLALVLGLAASIGPFAIDMYLPALPAIGTSLGASVSEVQWSLTAFFLSLGTGQLLYGPLSDMWGRKRPMYWGLGIFAVASVGCALASNIETLVAMRFLQGLGAAAGMVIPRAVVRDLHTGPEAARLMSLLMLVFSVSPILAPLVGSGVIAVTGWRGVFWTVTLAAAVGLVMLYAHLAETRPPEERADSSLGSALRGYGLLLRDWNYLGLVMIGSSSMIGFFVYMASSPFVFIDHYGLSPLMYSLTYSFNAVAFIGATQLIAPLGERFGLVRIVKAAAMAAGVVMLLLLAYYVAGGDNMLVLMAMYFISSAFMGMVIPTSSVLALEEHGAIAGTASALLGTLQMLVGALGMGVFGLFSNGKPLTMVIGMTVGAMLGVALTWMTLGKVGAHGAVPPSAQPQPPHTH